VASPRQDMHCILVLRCITFVSRSPIIHLAPQ
jgi:hypothetical protein